MDKPNIIRVGNLIFMRMVTTSTTCQPTASLYLGATANGVVFISEIHTYEAIMTLYPKAEGYSDFVDMVLNDLDGK